MNKLILILCVMLFSANVQSFNSSPKVFYPLPSLAEGKNIAAKSLFHGGEGGIWLQDVRNQVLFFDGEHIMPKLGSALEHEAEQLAFADNAFWTYFRNELYRTVPNQEKQLMLSLTPGTEIQSIGASQRFIWLSDQDFFYTYHIDTEQLERYSLVELYQYNHSSNISITDAKFVYSKWVLATSSGAFLSDQQSFQHVTSSGKNYIETLYFSPSRNELVIGSLNGAFVVNIFQPNQPVKKVSSSHVLSVAETDQAYWIGTESGLYVYSFADGKTNRFDQGVWAGDSLGGEKIYALLNDQQGGIWIATDRGVRYFSTFSRHFVRHDNLFAVTGRNSEVAIKIEPNITQDGYWMLTNRRLYRLGANALDRRELVYWGEVNDFEQGDGVLWLATKQGIVCIDKVTGEVISDDLPNALKQTNVRFIELDQQGLLWGAGDSQLWSYHLGSQSYTSFGSDWMIDQYLPAKLTDLSLISYGSLALGTDHGLYLLQDGQVRFVGESTRYGEVVDIEALSSKQLWIAGRYGAYQLNISQLQTQPLTMMDGHVTPKCILNNDNGIWLTSSSGLSRYARSGELLAHYGEPLGLINNEFIAGLCSYSSGNPARLVLGARQSFIEVDTDQLIDSAMPQVEVIFSQIQRNQRLFSLGNTVQQQLRANYGDSLFFQFGTIPSSSNLNLEFRLNHDDKWQLLDGATLSIEHLKAGDYTLEVRAVRNGVERSASKRFNFSVSEPWYLTSYALVIYVLLVTFALASVVYWRSRIMANANRELRAQVALKTNQLRHQSRVLVSNNQQLRKQLQVRRLIFIESVHALRNKLLTQTDPLQSGRSAVEYLVHELELLLNTRSTNGQACPVYNLSLILQSVIRGWQEELDKAAIHIEIETPQDFYVSLKRFNLDEIFNLIFASIVKRCYRNQTVMIQLQRRDGWVTVAILDQGNRVMGGEGDNSDEFAQLVEQSGGRVYRHVSNERNLIELSWPNSEAFEEQTTATTPIDEASLQKHEHDPWLEKLTYLVEKHYSDPEFSTSAAAKHMFVSERSLQRRVKSAFDKTFTEYLTDVRLDNACRRLLAGGKVSDVAFECGFNDPSYFSQRFKHRFGLSPTQFVEQQEAL